MNLGSNLCNGLFSRIYCCIPLQVIGWRLVKEDGKVKLQCLWKLRDFECGVELINRIFNVVKSTGHLPNIHLEPPNQVRAELWTSSIGNHHSCLSFLVVSFSCFWFIGGLIFCLSFYCYLQEG